MKENYEINLNKLRKLITDSRLDYKDQLELTLFIGVIGDKLEVEE